MFPAASIGRFTAGKRAGAGRTVKYQTQADNKYVDFYRNITTFLKVDCKNDPSIKFSHVLK